MRANRSGRTQVFRAPTFEVRTELLRAALDEFPRPRMFAAPLQNGTRHLPHGQQTRQSLRIRDLASDCVPPGRTLRDVLHVHSTRGTSPGQEGRLVATTRCD